MEPAAPGTEEESQVGGFGPAGALAGGSKKITLATEQDRLLALKSILPDGEFGNVFELTYNNGAEHWYCRVCQCPIMGRVFYHETGKRHSQNICDSQAAKSAERCEQRENTDEDVVHEIGEDSENGNAGDFVDKIRVAPGEPVPPGFEGEVTKVAHIQERLDNFHSGSLLGLEYLLEIQDYDQEKYLCLLCGKKGDPRTVIAHLVSYNHLQGYLQRHFPKTWQALAPYVTRQYKKNWQDTMNKIAEAIETKYGRLLPHPVEAVTFDGRRDQIYQMIHLGPHFSEKNGVTFEHLVIKDEITKVSDEDAKEQTGSSKKRDPSPPVVSVPKKPKSTTSTGTLGARRRSLSSVSSISSSDLSDFDEKKLEKAERNRRFNATFRRRTRSRSRSPRRGVPRPRIRSPYRSFRDRRDSCMPWNRPDYVRNKVDKDAEKAKLKTDKMEEFKKLANATESDMDKVLKQHKSNPEKHPQYNDEWKIFWNRRYKELQAEGKDASKYDFKPEWIIYWNQKIVEMHKAEVKVKIDALRKRLGIPPEPAPISFKIGTKKEILMPKPIASLPDQDHEVIVIDDKDDNSRSPLRSQSPWETDSKRRERRSRDKHSRDRDRNRRNYTRRSRERSWDRDRRRDYRSRDRDFRSRDKSWERDINYHREARKDGKIDPYKPPSIMRDVSRNPVDYSTKEIPNDDINIVAVLRLLAALEEKLGSLGPKVVDLLAKALAMEKKEANSSETLLDCEMTCVLFETIKEKLKGQLHAGLVVYNQEKAFKVAIKKIASLIHLAGWRKTGNKTGSDVKVLGIGTVDKSAIAKQIATALVLQGKTDVSQAELEQLINAVVGMAEASKNSNKPMTTASFLQSLHKVQEESKDAPSTSEKSSMDGLSDSDLQTLLQNFKDLSAEEQHGLITYLKKMEAKEPERVERLREFVNLGQNDESKVTKEETNERAISPFSKKLSTAELKKIDEKKLNDGITKIDSDEEDYSFDDLIKAADKKVQEDTLKRDNSDMLQDAKALIANIMGSIASKTNEKPAEVPQPSPTPRTNFIQYPKTNPYQFPNPNQFPNTNQTHPNLPNNYPNYQNHPNQFQPGSGPVPRFYPNQPNQSNNQQTFSNRGAPPFNQRW